MEVLPNREDRKDSRERLWFIYGEGYRSQDMSLSGAGNEARAQFVKDLFGDRDWLMVFSQGRECS